MDGLRPLILLSLQRALMGMVTPDLRAVEVDVGHRRALVHFYYETDVADEHEAIVSEG